MSSAAIMQPTYLGWLGYFDLLDKADTFVLLDTVPVNTRSWQMRNRIRSTDGRVHWLTVPIWGGQGQRLDSVRIDASQPWQRKHWRTIQHAYGKTPYWDDVEEVLADIYAHAWTWLHALTESLILNIADYLGISTRLCRASALPAASTDRVGRLVDICRYVGADTLLEPTGGTYLSQDVLPSDITLQWHDYQHPTYSQGDAAFQSNLSVIDLIAWHGPDSLDIIRSADRVAV